MNLINKNYFADSITLISLFEGGGEPWQYQKEERQQLEKTSAVHI